MTYSLQRLAPGSYDILLGDEVVAALALAIPGQRKTPRWFADA